MQPQSCECCQREIKFGRYRFYSLGCIYCGARLIQRLRTSEARTRNLKDWVARGHDEKAIRALVAEKNVPIEFLKKGKR